MTDRHYPHLLLQCLVVSVACGTMTQALVCHNDVCVVVRCAQVTQADCQVGERLTKKAGYCGCCDACLEELEPHEPCELSFFLGIDIKGYAPCTSGYYCGPSLTCEPIILG